ncbi:MAG: hypothetical protein HY716_12015 [Planctomycetes bacterium]|nr:hypothetical protein [Planctomycetota bacterium]
MRDLQREESLAALAPSTDGRIPVAKLVIDLHTGKALFGKSGEVYWIHAGGWSLAFLVFTGLGIWIKIQWHKLWVHRRKCVPFPCAKDCIATPSASPTLLSRGIDHDRGPVVA